MGKILPGIVRFSDAKIAIVGSTRDLGLRGILPAERIYHSIDDRFFPRRL